MFAEMKALPHPKAARALAEAAAAAAVLSFSMGNPNKPGVARFKDGVAGVPKSGVLVSPSALEALGVAKLPNVRLLVLTVGGTNIAACALVPPNLKAVLVTPKRLAFGAGPPGCEKSRATSKHQIPGSSKIAFLRNGM